MTARLWSDRAERLTLCGLLREPDLAVPAVCRWVRGEDFYHAAHGLVFGVVVGRWNEFRPVTLDRVYLALRVAGRLADLGPRPACWLADLYDADPVGAEAPYYARLVRWYADRRRAVRAARQAEADALAGLGAYSPAGLLEVG